MQMLSSMGDDHDLLRCPLGCGCLCRLREAGGDCKRGGDQEFQNCVTHLFLCPLYVGMPVIVLAQNLRRPTRSRLRESCAPVTVPNAVLVADSEVLRPENCGWLKTLCASTRRVKAACSHRGMSRMRPTSHTFGA